MGPRRKQRPLCRGRDAGMRRGPIPELTEAQRIRFWSKVCIGGPDDCWLWQRGKDKDGYGKVSLSYRDLRAHRVAYVLANYVDPGAFLVCHSCDTPACCNPAHLWLGTVADNDADRDVKGRANGPRGIKNKQHKLTTRQVKEIRQSCEVQRIIAKRFGVSRSLVSMIRNRVIWRYLAA